jgi:hypothetical protein
MPFSRLPSQTRLPFYNFFHSLLLIVPFATAFPSAAQSTVTQAPDTQPSIAAPGHNAPGTRVVVPKTPAGKEIMPVDRSRLSADKVSYEGGVIVLEGNARFLTSVGEITAQSVRVDTENQIVKASGTVTIKRQRVYARKLMRASHLPTRYVRETVTETLRGDNLDFDFKSRKGQLDHAAVELAELELNVANLTINGDKYIARNVVLRPGMQTPEEDKIYGVPPLNLRARQIVITVPRKDGSPSVRLKGGALYFKNRRLLPVPGFIPEREVSRQFGGSGGPVGYSFVPSLSLNSTDRVLLAARLRFPLDKTINGLSFVTDLGTSANLGFRGGPSLELNNSLGQLALRGKVKDIITTQLTNRIQLDRLPELSYNSPTVRLLKLPGHRQTGIRFEGSWGDFRERIINTPNGGTIRSSRRMAGVHFTTRLPNRDRTVPSGPYIDLFASTARYSFANLGYRTSGYEIGYDGKFLSKWSGVLLYRYTKLRGDTPFRFDEVEIPREVRATLDFQYSPRYAIPLDFRYDIDRKDLRDASFGLLRTYKAFAYGMTYNTARSNLSFELRTGF